MMRPVKLLAVLIASWLRRLFAGGEAGFNLPVQAHARLFGRRLRRRQLCDYLSTMIRSCSSCEGDVEETCNKAVQASLHFHDKFKAKNGGICLMGKYHNVLYIAARLAFLFRLRNNETISRLLAAIFHCEETFERIISGAIFGPKLCGAISGWKSEFDSREECLAALRYFLQHANQARMYFKTKSGEILKMADVRMIVTSHTPPITLAFQAQRPDVFKLLLEFGAEVHNMPMGILSPMDLLSEKRTCHFEEGNEACLEIAEKLHLGGYGWPLPSLKQLARNSVRATLNENFQLPMGIDLLPIPLSLMSYLRLEEN